MIFNDEPWKQVIAGFMVQDCTLGFEENRLGLLLVEESDENHLDDGWRSKLVAVRLDQAPGTGLFATTTSALGFATIASAWSPDQTEFVTVDTAREVLSYKPKSYRGKESTIPFDGLGFGYAEVGAVGSAIVKLVRVGTTVYAVGSPMRIYQRMPNQSWMEHTGLPIPGELKSKRDNEITAALGVSTLRDLAGFSGQNMYAVGEAGTVWHFDGDIWAKQSFPSNLALHTASCGSDGFVYITDIRGSVWIGGKSTWKRICEMNQSLPFVDSAWFNDRFWCANDYGMYVLEGANLVPAHTAKRDPIPKEVALYAHRIDVSPNGKTMLVCSRDGIAMCTGSDWQILYSPFA